MARWSALENNPRSGAPFLDSQSVDRGEWRIGAFSIWNIVVAYYRKLMRHGQAPSPGFFDHRDCQHDRHRQDGGRIGRGIEHHARRIAVPGIGLNHGNVIDVEASIEKSVGIAMKLLLIGGCASRLWAAALLRAIAPRNFFW